MRILFFIPALAALVTIAGAALPDNSCGLEIGCGHVGPTRERGSRAVHGLTNAELLRRGLPPKSPVLRRGTPVRRANPSTVPNLPTSTITHHGAIQVLDSNGNFLGYISKKLIRATLQFQPTLDDALVVTFQTESRTGSGTKLALIMANGDADFPLLGLIQGLDDQDSSLQSGSYQYLYLGGVSAPATQPGADPQDIGNSYASVAVSLSRTAESSVWTFDSSTGNLSPKWVNPGGSVPPIQYWAQDTNLYAGGDAAAFSGKYPAFPITLVTFKFVQS